MKCFALSVTLHQLKQWFGVPNVMIFCVPSVYNTTNHSTISLEDYIKLQTVVQAMKYHCEDHDEPHHM
jgi:hypothetical protein